MIIGIFAPNIRDGGGVTHLIELLSNACRYEHDFEKIVLWSTEKTLSKIDSKDWLVKKEVNMLAMNSFTSLFFQYFFLPRQALKESCDVLFFPGGSFNTRFKPIVTMHRNLLPFEIEEIKRYGYSFLALKFHFLRLFQSASMKKADGVIFLTNYARNRVVNIIGNIKGKSPVVYHGIKDIFFLKPKRQLPIEEYSFTNPFKLINVSGFQPYKHQWIMAKAVSLLRKEGYPIECHFIGSGHKKSISRLEAVIEKEDKSKEFLKYHGSVSYKEIHEFYKSVNLLVCTSSVEAFGQTLTEGMAAGLPVACSQMSVLPEVLGDTGLYFNPLEEKSITACLKKFLDDAKLREYYSSLSYKRAKSFSWKQCANETFSLLKTVTLDNK